MMVDPDQEEGQELLGGLGLLALDTSGDSRFVLFRRGRRGAHTCQLWDRTGGVELPLLSYPEAGSTDHGLLRPAPPGARGLVAYLVTDAGMARTGLVAVPITADGKRGEAGAIASRTDADLEMLAADGAGRVLVLVWNCAGRSTVEVIDVHTGERRIAEPPGSVVTGVDVAFNGRSAVMANEGPGVPSELWHLDLESMFHGGRAANRARLHGSLGPAPVAAMPTLETLVSHDGLEISGWLYRAREAAAPGPVLINLHGGPEAQERPSFHPDYQVLVATGVNVFAPNIRGSAGFGRDFVHADDRFGRLDAIDDVASCAHFLLERGVAVRGRVFVGGRSYGGYAALMALIRHPDLFAAGIDICGMSDLLNFYRDTEPWIARAAVTKYGHPQRDRSLLLGLSPLHHVQDIKAPLLVIHGALDTNVPIGESHRLVAALRGIGREVHHLEIEGEGHEFRRTGSRQKVIAAIVSFLADVSSR
jgi:dipeptidyl aminopeptidase/acylaminoacyl peptidase